MARPGLWVLADANMTHHTYQYPESGGRVGTPIRGHESHIHTDRRTNTASTPGRSVCYGLVVENGTQNGDFDMVYLDDLPRCPTCERVMRTRNDLPWCPDCQENP
jgi:hypothetical protein